MTRGQIVIVGAGDHGRVIADLADAAGWAVAGFVEPGPERGERRAVSGLPFLGKLDNPEPWAAIGRFVVALGDNVARAAAWDQCLAAGLRSVALVHPSATLLGGSTVDDGAQVCAGAIVGVDAHVGADAILNTAATIDHDAVLSMHAQVGPGAHLAGRVTVGEGAMIGTGAVVIPGRSIGMWSVVAAGATVIDDVLPRSRVGGVPARPIAPPHEAAS